jgi:hypothetical protein
LISAYQSVSGCWLGSITKTLRRAVSRRGSQQSERDVKDKDTSHFSDSTTEEFHVSEDPDWSSTGMALRCLSNALFLNEGARLPFSTEDDGGGHVAVAFLARPQDTPADTFFLGARLLFFSTLFESPFNKIAVTALSAVRVEARCVDALVKVSLDKAADRNAASSVLVASGTPAQLNTALSDLLKAHSNNCLYDAAALRPGCRRAAALAVRWGYQAHDRDDWLWPVCGLPHEHRFGLCAALGGGGDGRKRTSRGFYYGQVEPTDEERALDERSTA